jgi:tRNA(Arg) A34 adenosine deaminase TadA
MCLGALYYASPDRVVFVVTREEEGRHYRDDQRYFEFENFYGEYSKAWRERRLPMEHQPEEGGSEVYRRWRELNS